MVSDAQDHIPKRCTEVEADLKLTSRHTVEEAMSEALMRKCPHCSKPYIKMDGCNKILCSACNKLSCFVCLQAIQNYQHFEGHGARGSGAKCPLYDANEARVEAERVRSARDAAQLRVLEDARATGVEVEQRDLDVDGPEIPPERPPPAQYAHMRRAPGLVGLGLVDVAPAMVRQGERFRYVPMPPGGPFAPRPLQDLPGAQQPARDAQLLGQGLFNPPGFPVYGLRGPLVRPRDARGRYIGGGALPPPINMYPGANAEARLQAWREDVAVRRRDVEPRVAFGQVPAMANRPPNARPGWHHAP